MKKLSGHGGHAGNEPGSLWFKRFWQRSCWRQFCFVRADHRYGLLHVFQ